MKLYEKKHMLRTSKGLDITVYECNPDQFTDDIWQQYVELSQSLSREYDPDSPPPPAGVLKEMMLDPSPEWEPIRYLAFDSGTDELIGKCVIYYPGPISPLYEESLSTADLQVDVAILHRRKGVATALLQTAAERLIPLGRADVQLIFSMPSAKKFFDRMGARVISDRAVNRLRMRDVDWDRMEEWTGNTRALQEGVRLEFHDTVIPEKDLEEYCRVYTGCGRSVPDYQAGFVPEEQISPESRRAAEERWKRHGRKCFILFSREPDGAMSGITECFYSEASSHMAEQDLTGVLVPYRNRGIGKWLKAAMLLYLRDEHPEVEAIDSFNANDNPSINAINTAMGYSRFRDQWLGKLELTPDQPVR